MYEEQKLIAAGVPFSEAFPLCVSARRDIALGRLEAELEEHGTCKCGGVGNCPDCPNRNR